jgi:hypothetical protein
MMEISKIYQKRRPEMDERRTQNALKLRLVRLREKGTTAHGYAKSLCSNNYYLFYTQKQLFFKKFWYFQKFLLPLRAELCLK